MSDEPERRQSIGDWLDNMKAEGAEGQARLDKSTARMAEEKRLCERIVELFQSLPNTKGKAAYDKAFHEVVLCYNSLAERSFYEDNETYELAIKDMKPWKELIDEWHQSNIGLD